MSLNGPYMPVVVTLLRAILVTNIIVGIGVGILLVILIAVSA